MNDAAWRVGGFVLAFVALAGVLAAYRLPVLAILLLVAGAVVCFALAHRGQKQPKRITELV